MGKVDYKLLIDKKAIADILDKYTEVHPPNDVILALDYQSLQVYYMIEAVRLYMEDQLLEPNFKVELDE